jgi:hypothetical protein
MKDDLCGTTVLGNYAADIEHWASSSTQASACSVEPGTAADVSVIVRSAHTSPCTHFIYYTTPQIQILGSTQTPFAVSTAQSTLARNLDINADTGQRRRPHRQPRLLLHPRRAHLHDALFRRHLRRRESNSRYRLWADLGRCAYVRFCLSLYHTRSLVLTHTGERND